MSEYCTHLVGRSTCGYKATRTRAGKLYCAMHDPVRLNIATLERAVVEAAVAYRANRDWRLPFERAVDALLKAREGR